MKYKLNNFGISALICVIISAILMPAYAQPSRANSQFFAALDDYRGSRPGDSGALLRLKTALAQRRQNLQNLISSDPAAVLAAAAPDDVRDSVPADVRSLVEQHVKL